MTAIQTTTHPHDVSFRSYLDELSSRPVKNSRLDRARTKVLDSAERLTTWGPLGPIAETGWRVWRRDQEIAGSVLAAALAYRVFIWLLPLALVLVAGFGFTGASFTSHALSDLGVTNYVSQSVSNTARAGSWFGRVVIIISGTIVFLYESYVLLRTLRAISAFAWHMRVRPLRRPAQQVLFFLGISLVLVVGLALTNKIAGSLFFPLGLIVAIASLLAIVPAYVVMVSMVLLPNPGSQVDRLLPGRFSCMRLRARAPLGDAWWCRRWPTSRPPTGSSDLRRVAVCTVASAVHPAGVTQSRGPLKNSARPAPQRAHSRSPA